MFIKTLLKYSGRYSFKQPTSSESESVRPLEEVPDCVEGAIHGRVGLGRLLFNDNTGASSPLQDCRHALFVAVDQVALRVG